MKKRLLISTMVATLLLGSTSLYAESSTEKTAVSQNTKASISKENKKQTESFKEAPKEIVDGFNQTLEAIKALEEDNIDKAKKALKNATENFSTALKAAPQLDLVPFAQEVVVNEFIGDSKSVQKALILAVALIDKHDTQAARAVMMPLQDEMVVTTSAIPMKLYPVATEDARKALEKGDKDAALEILNVSLNTIVSETVLMPIPLLVAEDLVLAASALDKEQKEDALKLLALAQDELQKAVYLGYTKKHSDAYKALEDEIEAIKKEIKGKNVVEKLYDKIKESFNSLIEKNRDESTDSNNSK
jgi:tetratricopeptide (TPR) repeat protein